jgi:hypothetical protein
MNNFLRDWKAATKARPIWFKALQWGELAFMVLWFIEYRKRQKPVDQPSAFSAYTGHGGADFAQKLNAAIERRYAHAAEYNA